MSWYETAGRTETPKQARERRERAERSAWSGVVRELRRMSNCQLYSERAYWEDMSNDTGVALVNAEIRRRNRDQRNNPATHHPEGWTR